MQDQGVSNGFLSRVQVCSLYSFPIVADSVLQYNDLGPSGIHEVGLAF